MRTVLVLVAVAVLAGCGTDPADLVRRDVRALTEAANDGDADAVRDRADALLTTVDEQRGELGGEEAERLIAMAQSVRKNADAIDADLIERRRAEAEAAAAAKALEEARQQLEEERRKAEEAAREDDDKGEGKGKGDEQEKDD